MKQPIPSDPTPAHQIKCLEVWVRFVSPNHHGLRISRNGADTRTHYLHVVQTTDRLTIYYCDKEGDVIKTNNFNFAEVLEYDTEGYVR